MLILKTIADVTALIENKKNEQKSIGFIPTMGALHQGHISLIDAGKKENDFTVCSIFINPTQFNNAADFKKYPVTIESDIDMLEASGCDLLFLPSVDEIYPPGFIYPLYDIGYLETVLEGQYRPGHYQGVCQVVDRLLSAVMPHILYLGQKDYQQCMVIKKLLELKNYNCNVHIEKTIREADGLAMSSRNARLNKIQREQAVKIYTALSLIKNELKAGSLDYIKKKAKTFLTGNGFKVDYAEVTNSDLTLLQSWDGKTKTVILIAAYLDDIRLIDNFVDDGLLQL